MNSPRSRRRGALLLALAALAALLALPVSAQPPAGEDAAPAVAAFAKNGTADQVFSFSPDDFVVEQGEEALDSIVLTSLPDSNAGVLTLGGMDLAVGEAVALEAVSGMAFRPNAAPTAATTSFTFTPVFADGSSGADVRVDLYLLTAENSAPIAQDLELSTYKNVAAQGQFSAVDPEGDLLTFRLVDKPARGAVTLPEDGSAVFTYTPYENKTGKDSFTYVAVDAVGNTSAPATVKVKIEKARTKVTYADMDGVSAYRSALRLAEEGVLIGECVGGAYFFQPEQTVSREEFVTLAMHTMGLEALEGVTRTGFADDEAIPTWAKGYVSSALKSGYVQGLVSAEGVVFDPERAITRAEAAVLLDRMLQVTDAAVTTLYTDYDAAPAWAFQAAVNLETAGVLQADADGSLSLSQPLTRAGAADLLCGALDVLENREAQGWSLW